MPDELVVEDVRIGVPPGWRRRASDVAGVVLALSPVPAPEGSRPAVVVTAAEVTAPATSAGHRARQVAELEADLEGVRIEDEDAYDLHGYDVSYLRLAHATGGSQQLAEVWTWLVGGVAWTLTANVELAQYGEWGEVFEAIAETFEPGVLRPAG